MKQKSSKTIQDEKICQTTGVSKYGCQIGLLHRRVAASCAEWHKYVRHQKDPKNESEGSSCFVPPSKLLYSIWMLFSVFISKDLPKIDWLESWFNRKAKKVSFVLFLRKLSPRRYVKMHHVPAVASEFVDVVINIQLPNIQATFSDDRRTENPGEVRPAKIKKADLS